MTFRCVEPLSSTAAQRGSGSAPVFDNCSFIINKKMGGISLESGSYGVMFYVLPAMVSDNFRIRLGSSGSEVLPSELSLGFDVRFRSFRTEFGCSWAKADGNFG